ncbi:hypothetical protein O9992_13145 [Vibrio lentus]|nr:hypothetical protein [Vibrio lentus]
MSVNLGHQNEISKSGPFIPNSCAKKQFILNSCKSALINASKTKKSFISLDEKNNANGLRWCYAAKKEMFITARIEEVESA